MGANPYTAVAWVGVGMILLVNIIFLIYSLSLTFGHIDVNTFILVLMMRSTYHSSKSFCKILVGL